MLQVDLVFKKNLPEGSLEKLMDYLEARLAAHPFIVGEDFSVGDVAVTSYLIFFKVFLPQVGMRSPPEQCLNDQLPKASPLPFNGSWRHLASWKGVLPLSELRHTRSQHFISTEVESQLIRG